MTVSPLLNAALKLLFERIRAAGGVRGIERERLRLPERPYHDRRRPSPLALAVIAWPTRWRWPAAGLAAAFALLMGLSARVLGRALVHRRACGLGVLAAAVVAATRVADARTRPSPRRAVAPFGGDCRRCSRLPSRSSSSTGATRSWWTTDAVRADGGVARGPGGGRGAGGAAPPAPPLPPPRRHQRRRLGRARRARRAGARRARRTRRRRRQLARRRRLQARPGLLPRGPAARRPRRPAALAGARRHGRRLLGQRRGRRTGRRAARRVAQPVQGAAPAEAPPRRTREIRKLADLPQALARFAGAAPVAPPRRAG